MKKKVNLTFGEKTIGLLTKHSQELELSISSLITMLINQYDKEQNAINMMNNKELLNQIMAIKSNNGSNQWKKKKYNRELNKG